MRTRYHTNLQQEEGIEQASLTRAAISYCNTVLHGGQGQIS